jgi:hypothetical protein
LTSQFNKHNNQLNNSERDRVRFTLFASTWTIAFSALFLMLFVHSATGSILTSVLAHFVLSVFPLASHVPHLTLP